ncbi:DUF4843 domain-containing protein [Arachidicoccus sp.]|uniref:DUF4843 domain-containing protein n=1 Tax=Arachidicoccus sp. TaxID=1872624 RepID=UPI003D1A6D15
MKRNTFIFVVLIGIFLSACQKADLKVYNSPANVYFDFPGTQSDSLLYTFAFEPSRGADTVYLPVKLSGIRESKDRRFIVKIDPNPDSTTAVVYKHYKPLDSVYILKANTGETRVPLVIYNSDSLLQSRSVKIKFHLYPTADLDTSLNQPIKGQLVFSSKLERPDWWGMWLGDYFSQAKFQLFIITTGQISMTTNGQDAPKNLYFKSLLLAFLNDPFNWIKKNPGKGYVLEQQSDGSYYFYGKDNPNKKILYRYDAQAAQYFFIDENGLEIN